MTKNNMRQEPEEEHSDPVVYTLNSGETVGLSAAQLSKLLNISSQQAGWIISETGKMAQNGEISDSADIANLIMALSDISDGDSQPIDTEALLHDLTLQAGVIQAGDIAKVFNIQRAFAAKLLHLYGEPINDEADFDKFFVFLKDHIQKNYNGQFPQAYRQPDPTADVANAAPAPTQEAAPVYQTANLAASVQKVETDKRTDAKIVDDSRLEKALSTVPPAQDPETTKISAEAEEKERLRRLYQIFSEKLDISPEDAEYILSDVENFSVIAGIEDKEEAQRVFNDALNGKTDEAFAYIDRNRRAEETPEPPVASAPQQTAPPPPVTQAAQPEQAPPKKAAAAPLKSLPASDTTSAPQPTAPPKQNAGGGSAPIPPLPKTPAPEEKAEKTAPKPPETEETEAKAEKEQVETLAMPPTLEESLRLCMQLRGRITGKTMSEIFKSFGADISVSLARFIIEEGKYGGEGEDKKKIIRSEEAERLITDIDGNLREFVRTYLQAVNNQVKNMLYGGE